MIIYTMYNGQLKSCLTCCRLRSFSSLLFSFWCYNTFFNVYWLIDVLKTCDCFKGFAKIRCTLELVPKRNYHVVSPQPTKRSRVCPGAILQPSTTFWNDFPPWNLKSTSPAGGPTVWRRWHEPKCGCDSLWQTQVGRTPCFCVPTSPEAGGCCFHS